MSLFVTNETAIDPITGIPVQLGFVIMTENGDYISTSPTGEPRYGLNTLPGTDQNFPTTTTTIAGSNFLGTTDPNNPMSVPGGPLDTESLEDITIEDGSLDIVLEPTIGGYGALAILGTETGAELILDPDSITRTIIGLPYGFVDIPSTGVLY